ncbi:MAG: cyclic nucleotide-binding domain-containing protein [Acidobacteriota bacterium]
MKKNYLANEIIFQDGDLSEVAYLIKKGKVEILQGYPENPIRLAILNKDEIFGEMSLFEERPRSLTARALNRTQLSTFTRDEFLEFIQNNPDNTSKYLRMFFERLRAMNLWVKEQANEQAKVITQSLPLRKEFQVTIFPLTQVAKNYIPEQGYLIRKHIFRVGRRPTRHEDPFEVNDLILQDTPPYNISRNHFSIEKTPDRVIANDRGSFLGTIVNGQMIGGFHRGALIPLKEGENEIIAGSQISPFKFCVIIQTAII